MRVISCALAAALFSPAALAQTCPAGGCPIPVLKGPTVSGGVFTFTNADGTTTTLNSGSAAALAAAVPTTSTQSAAYTLQASDCPNSIIRDTGTTAHSYTVPTGLPAGSQIRVIQTAAGAVSVVAGSGETAEVANTANAAGVVSPSNTTSGVGSGLTIVIDSASTYHLAPAA